MFILSELKYVVRVLPRDFDKPLEEAVTEQLNETFAYKVILGVGLGLCLFDIRHLGDSYIIPGDGSSYTKVTFRLVVFRPFIGELLIGRIKNSNPGGIVVTLEFFDDIFIPCQFLPYPSYFDQTQRMWVWRYTTVYRTINTLYMNPGHLIRFKVVNELFSDKMPEPRHSKTASDGTTWNKVQREELVQGPYCVIGAINQPGLGMMSWWRNTL